MKKKLGLLTLFLLISFGYISNEARVPDLLANSRDLYAKIKVLTSILETVQRVYVEEKDPDELIEDAIKGVLANLDPHTVYLPADDFKNWNQSFEGYSGIGISFEILDGEITVMSVVHGSPADKVGIRAGDKIVAVDGQRMIGVKRENAAASLHGPVGLPVALKVVSDRWRKPREFQLVRERISLESVPYAMMLQHQIGYIKIDRFTSTTSRELERALKRLERQHMVGLILDLRGNSGGYLNAAVDVADKFIPGGNKIVTTRGRLASSYREYFATDEATHPLYPLVVLLDHGAASASEIVAGAIQDLDRGLIVGKTSFGKGLV
ncbi:MAG: S41 family peptidase, partial [Calditrichaeota bacterium]